MKKGIIFTIIFSCIFLSAGKSFAESEYIGKSLPSDEVICKNYLLYLNSYSINLIKASYKLDRLIGKYKHADDFYDVYFLLDKNKYGKSSSEFSKASLKRLDTNTWIISQSDSFYGLIIDCQNKK